MALYSASFNLKTNFLYSFLILNFVSAIVIMLPKVPLNFQAKVHL